MYANLKRISVLFKKPCKYELCIPKVFPLPLYFFNIVTFFSCRMYLYTEISRTNWQPLIETEWSLIENSQLLTKHIFYLYEVLTKPTLDHVSFRKNFTSHVAYKFQNILCKLLYFQKLEFFRKNPFLPLQLNCVLKKLS